MANWFTRLFGKKTAGSDKEESPSPVTTSKNSDRDKFPRPRFTKDETIALGSLALSFIIKDGRPDQQAEGVLINELEGLQLQDIQHIYKNLQTNLIANAQLLQLSFAYDAPKKLYAAFFLARVIKSRSDGGNEPTLEDAWSNCVRNILRINMDVGLADASKLFDDYDHGHLSQDELFPVLVWLSQIEYAQKSDNTIERTSKQEMDSYKNKTVFTVGEKVSFTMIRVDGGCFIMGGFVDEEDSYHHEGPRHDVSVSTFLIGETQVTQELWEAVMGSNPSQFKGKNKPVESVSWKDCVDFIHKLNEMTGKHFRLPTEAEWEYAARGGQLSKNYTFSGSNDRNEVAWQPENSEHTTHDVKTKKPNELGIFDMSGNVLEWVNDWFGEYPDEKQTDPTGPSYGRYKVLRGGSWYNPSSFCRVSFRNYMEPESVNFMYGIRLAL